MPGLEILFGLVLCQPYTYPHPAPTLSQSLAGSGRKAGGRASRGNNRPCYHTTGPNTSPTVALSLPLSLTLALTPTGAERAFDRRKPWEGGR